MYVCYGSHVDYTTPLSLPPSLPSLSPSPPPLSPSPSLSPHPQYGLTKMLQSEQGLIIFVSAMDPYNENMMADVLRVAAAVCLVADGYVTTIIISHFHTCTCTMDLLIWKCLVAMILLVV